MLVERLSCRSEEELTKDELVALFRAVAKERRLKFSALMKLLRLALSGVEVRGTGGLRGWDEMRG